MMPSDHAMNESHAGARTVVKQVLQCMNTCVYIAHKNLFCGLCDVLLVAFSAKEV